MIQLYAIQTVKYKDTGFLYSSVVKKGADLKESDDFETVSVSAYGTERFSRSKLFSCRNQNKKVNLEIDPNYMNKRMRDEIEAAKLR